MAKVKITGHASGSGVFTITAPNSNTDRTITLPDASVTLGTDATKLPLAGGAMTGATTHADNVKNKFGTGNDLEIYHDGSHSYIEDVGTGDLRLRGNDVVIRGGSNEDMIKGYNNGKVALSFDNAVKLETSATGVKVTGKITGAVGSVLQVVQTATNTQIVNTTDGANVDLMNVNITPSSSSSKVLVMITWFEGASNPNGAYRLYRGSTSLGVAASGYGDGTGFWAYDDAATTTHQMESKSFTFLDSPNTASQVNYKLSTDSSSSVYFNRSLQGSSGHSTSTITVMEIGA